MSISFDKLLTDCLVALGDPLCVTWSRTDVIWPWCLEAMLQFPILRPMELSYTMVSQSHCINLASDFREIISVEYPVSQEPPQYLTRKNRFDPDFYTLDTYYDIDRNYTEGTGWVLWFSKNLAIGQVVTINYLANHDTNLIDDPSSLITVPDEYENILVSYVVMKGYRERLGAYMQDPTAHTSIIQQMTNMVLRAEQDYQDLIASTMAKYTDSKTTPHFEVDKYDRVY